MLSFTKMHGNGNDFIIIDEFEKEAVFDQDKANFATRYCDRRFGIGADGVLYISASNKADLKMRLFQPDGSEAEMCGNGIRCLAKYAIDKNYVQLGSFTVETLNDILRIEARKDDEIWIKVDMGKPRFDRREIPADGEGEFLEEDLYGYTVSAVNTGVPHAVIFVNDLDIVLEEVASEIRFHQVFPLGANVNFALVKGDKLHIRTYERGLEAESLSCGTGSVACAVVAWRLGKVKGDEIDVKTKGGVLCISKKDGRAYMEGTAETVYEGVIR
ncbi:MAG: diaminopimelate epimerase [Halobacteriota archaeon]|nr:diaminopimelate epimerase [Halobacteriota archaeon]